jgi:hypothetical protein
VCIRIRRDLSIFVLDPDNGTGTVEVKKVWKFNIPSVFKRSGFVSK